MINTQPTICNICGGPVTYGSNSRVYGKEYGSGYCYLCEISKICTICTVEQGVAYISIAKARGITPRMINNLAEKVEMSGRECENGL